MRGEYATGTENDVIAAVKRGVDMGAMREAVALYVRARSFRECVAAEIHLYATLAPLLRKPRHHLTKARKALVIGRDGCCIRCGVTGFLAVDHLFPASRGGSGQMWNLAAMCSGCNSSKGTALMPWALWLMLDQLSGCYA